MALSKVRATKDDPLNNKDFDALPEHEESTAEEIHALIEKEKEDFITFEEYANVAALISEICELQEQPEYNES